MLKYGMLKTLITSIFLISFGYAKPQAIPVCSMYYVSSVKAKLTDGRSDKYMHCAVSCMLTNRCNSIDVFSMGFLKEVSDLFTPGDADYRDLKANSYGIGLSIHKRAVDDKECNQLCFEKFK